MLTRNVSTNPYPLTPAWHKKHKSGDGDATAGRGRRRYQRPGEAIGAPGVALLRPNLWHLPPRQQSKKNWDGKRGKKKAPVVGAFFFIVAPTSLAQN